MMHPSSTVSSDTCSIVLHSLSRAVTEDERTRLYPELRRCLSDPRLPDLLPILSPGDPLRSDAQITGDAFEAATNGMENPDVWQALETLQPDSPLKPWAFLSLAIRELYHGNGDGTLRFIWLIPPDTPPARFAPLLSRLADPDRKARPRSGVTADCLADAVPDKAFEPLLDRILSEERIVRDLADEVRNSEEDIDVFIETASLVIREIYARSPEGAKRLYSLCLERILARDESPAQLMSAARTIFDKGEAFRLSAAALTGEEPGVASILWLKYALWGIRDDTLSERDLKVILFTAAATAKALGPQAVHGEGELGEELAESLGSAADAVWAEGERRFPGYIGSLVPLMEPDLEGPILETFKLRSKASPPPVQTVKTVKSMQTRCAPETDSPSPAAARRMRQLELFI